MPDGLDVAEPSLGYAAADRLFNGGTVLCDGAMGTCSTPGESSSTAATMNSTSPTRSSSATSTRNTFRPAQRSSKPTPLAPMPSASTTVWKIRSANQPRRRPPRPPGVTQIQDKQAAEAFVAGAIGPLGVSSSLWAKLASRSPRGLRRTGSRLVDGGGRPAGHRNHDLLAEAEQASWPQKGRPELPVIAMFTVDEDGNCLDGSSAPKPPPPN